MLTEELNQLIDAALTDGTLTPQKREDIRKKALLEGMDPDEVDVFIDSRLQEVQKKVQSVANKRTCPYCGFSLQLGDVKCSHCGSDVSMIANETAQKFSDGLIEITKRGDANSQAAYIRNFPISSSRDELLEMLLALQPLAHKNASGTVKEQWLIQEAYWFKYCECINKAKMNFATDSAFEPYFAYYKKESKKISLSPKAKGCLMILAILFAFQLLCTLIGALFN